MSKLVPKYSMWEAINAAIAVGVRALEEIRTLARTPGPPGRDGFGFDDMTLTHDGERTFTFRFVKGDVVSEKKFVVPMMIYRGVFRSGESYEEGDVCTWGGHIYHCDTATTDKPDGEQRCWTLAVKKGRDGKDGIIKPTPKPGPVKAG